MGRKRDIASELLTLLKAKPGKAFSIREIVRRLDLGAGQRRELKRVLRQLKDSGKLQELRNKHYTVPRETQLIGQLQVNSRGRARIKLEGEPPASLPSLIPVSRGQIGNAIHGDRVAVGLVKKRSGALAPTITKVMERQRQTIVGRYQSLGRAGGMVYAYNERINRPIQVARTADRKTLCDGYWVVVEVKDWTKAPEPMLGEIKEILGPPSAPGIDIMVIIKDAGVKVDFSPQVLQEAGQLPQQIPAEEGQKRADLRNLCTFTVDPVDAKDFDDALSIQRLANGLYRLGVHIADVSYYVTENTAIDKEAQERSTSIYPVDRVVPMLPERLSTNICSLRPDEDKLTISVFMDIDPKGEVTNYRIKPSLIRSRHRLTYNEVEAIYDRSDPWIVSKYKDIEKYLFQLQELTHQLIAMRDKKGRLDLDVPEPEIVFDSEGKVTNVRRRMRLFSHRVVEEAMILANETIARRLHKQGLPAIYRIHDPPSPEKMEELELQLFNFGIKIPLRQRVTQKQLQRAIAQAERIQYGYIARRLILRAMMRAVYSPENQGHFGLASICYTHFTSPIRRYPDLMVHRIMHQALFDSGLSKPRRQYLERTLPSIARHASEMEQRAQEIEFEAIDIKSLEFMSTKLGEEFEGTVSAVIPSGVFVELDLYPIEGLIPLRSLRAEGQYYDKVTRTVKSRRGKQGFRLGDRVMVIIDKVDLINKHLDLKLIGRI